MATKIVVVGSCMIDLNCYSPRLPKCGETLIGTKFTIGHGGKGANQCVAAARLGARTALIARLGEDTFGNDYLADLKRSNIDTEFVHITPKEHSGVAQISVSEAGENTIIIVPGANDHLSVEDITEARKKILDAEVLLFQFETPTATTVEALKLCQSHGRGIKIVNGAPAIAKPDPDIYKLADIFCINESEAELMTGLAVKSVQDAEQAVKALLQMGCKTVIITLGAQGAVFASNYDYKTIHVPTRAAKAVDTTGAGDAFLGALAYFIAEKSHLPLAEKIRRASEYATLTVEKAGTQSSFPYAKDVPESLFQ